MTGTSPPSPRPHAPARARTRSRTDRAAGGGVVGVVEYYSADVGTGPAPSGRWLVCYQELFPDERAALAACERYVARIHWPTFMSWRRLVAPTPAAAAMASLASRAKGGAA